MGLIDGFPVEDMLDKPSLSRNKDVRVVSTFEEDEDGIIILTIALGAVSEMYSAEFTLKYDNELFDFHGALGKEDLGECEIASHAENGQLEVTLAGSQAMAGDVKLIDLMFKKKKDNKSLDISFSRFLINEEEIIGLDNLHSESTPSKFNLSPNYPNPFNPVTNISFELPRSSRVSITIYNMLGQEIRTLLKEDQEAGFHSVQWDGRNEAGIRVSTGVYICRMKAGNYVKSIKMLLLQ